MTKKKTNGAYEYGAETFNVYVGCENDCVYCYAKAYAVVKKPSLKEKWTEMELNKSHLKKIKNWGTVMIPSTHDIFPENVEKMIETFLKLLKVGNKLMITTKPRFECIKKICSELKGYEDVVCFRFSISSGNDETLKLWEPGATSYKERLISLRYAFDHGFNTSISLEPMLESVDNTVALIRELYPMVNDTIWVGKMNMPAQRVSTNGFKHDQKIQEALKNLKTLHSDEEILRLAKLLRRARKIRWKDSIREIIKKY